ncbi:SH3 domain-containing protein, partial [Agrobacterium tumefaciens]
MGMRSVVSMVCIALSLGLFGVANEAMAQGAAKGASGLPLPRFVSLKSKRVNMRIGPSTDYAVSWMYMKSGMPVEIIQEYENWRRIRDADGTEGWVNQALLSGERTAV